MNSPLWFASQRLWAGQLPFLDFGTCRALAFTAACSPSLAATLAVPLPASSPDIAAEVVSPNDLFSEVLDKVAEYLDAGVRLVWLVEPATRQGAVHRSPDELRLVRDAGVLATAACRSPPPWIRGPGRSAARTRRVRSAARALPDLRFSTGPELPAPGRTIRPAPLPRPEPTTSRSSPGFRRSRRAG